MRLLILILATTALVSCAVTMASGRPKFKDLRDAIYEPAPGMARVVLFRRASAVFTDEGTVIVDGKLVARLSPWEANVVDLEPGTHSFTASAPRASDGNSAELRLAPASLSFLEWVDDSALLQRTNIGFVEHPTRLGQEAVRECYYVGIGWRSQLLRQSNTEPE